MDLDIWKPYDVPLTQIIHFKFQCIALKCEQTDFWFWPQKSDVLDLPTCWVSLVAQQVKNLPEMWETWVQSLGWEDPLGKGAAPTPGFWPGELHGLQSMGLQTVGHD